MLPLSLSLPAPPPLPRFVYSFPLSFWTRKVTMPSDTKAQLQRSLDAASSELNDVLRIQSSISIGRAPHVITAYDTFRTQMTMLFIGILLLVGLMGVGCGRFGSE